MSCKLPRKEGDKEVKSAFAEPLLAKQVCIDVCVCLYMCTCVYVCVVVFEFEKQVKITLIKF